MGYYVILQESTARIPADKLDEALTRLKALNHKPGVEKRGGSYGPNGKTESWFSWMDPNYDQTVTSAADVFRMVGFDVTESPEGLTLDYYDNKTGQEQLFIDEVADLFTQESYMTWRGEEGEFWQWTPQGTKQGKVTFE